MTDGGGRPPLAAVIPALHASASIDAGVRAVSPRATVMVFVKEPIVVKAGQTFYGEGMLYQAVT